MLGTPIILFGRLGIHDFKPYPCVAIVVGARVICNLVCSQAFCRLPNARHSSQPFASIVSDQNLIAPNNELEL